jgi:signal peptidase II
MSSTSVSIREGAWPWLVVSALVLGLDQLTKMLIEQHLELYNPIVILPVLAITRMHNTGAAFSFLADQTGWQRWFFLGLALLISAVLIAWICRSPRRGHSITLIGLASVLGGALGNAVDRMRLGHVVDFIQVHWHDHSFPAFNVADSAITVGAALLILDALFEPRKVV